MFRNAVGRYEQQPQSADFYALVTHVGAFVTSTEESEGLVFCVSLQSIEAVEPAATPTRTFYDHYWSELIVCLKYDCIYASTARYDAKGTCMSHR
jgi:hypothetical protein